MSKAALGRSGAAVGTPAYFADLNRDGLLTGYLSDQSGYDYHAALERVAMAASSVIAEVYGDLQTHAGVLRYVPAERRNQVAELVGSMCDLCSLTSADTGLAGECLSMLSLSGLIGMTDSMATEDELDQAAALISTGGSSGLDAFSRAAVVREAVQWGPDFAVGGDEDKRSFLEKIKNERTDAFLEAVWNRYYFAQSPGAYCGVNGCEFCSESYATELSGRLFAQGGASLYLQTDYAGQIQNELRAIIRQIEADVSAAKGENDFLTDEMGARLREAVSDLERCGVLGSFSLRVQIRELCWYTPLDADQITSLQRSLNSLRIWEPLKEDGVYGSKTSLVCFQFLDTLVHGTVPILMWIDPLQKGITGIESFTNAAGYSWLREAGTTLRLTQVDIGKYNGQIDFMHLNVRAPLSSTQAQKDLANSLNHMPISQEAYDLLKNFDHAARVIRTAGRMLMVVGAAFDAYELISTISDDLNDADQKIGISTYSAAAGIGGQWLGSLGGAKVGAMTGATIGTAILPGVGTVIGGAVGRLILGVAGGWAGGELGKWLVDITCLEG